MRLAVFTAEFPGRINTFFARDMAALVRAGVEIDVFPIYPLRARYWSAVPEYLNADVLPRNRVHHVSPLAGLRPTRTASWRRWARFVADTARVRAAAVRFGPDAIVKTEYSCLKAWSWARETSEPYDHVLAYWGNYTATAAYVFHRLLDGDDGDVPLSILLHAHDLYERQVFLRQKLLYADNILVVCEFNRRFLAARFPDVFPRIASKVHLHHLGVDVSSITPSFGERPANKCLAVGRLDPSKGFDDLLRAAAIVHRRGRDITVELVGDGEQMGTLRRLAESLGIADRVLFRGWLAFDVVPAAMTDATMLVHPSCGLGDAVPTVIKEAMALGTPVVGSTAVGIPELLDNGQCGLLVPERQIEQLADAIERLLVDPALRARLARTARVFAERTFDVWRNGERLAALLQATRRAPAGASLTGSRAICNAP
jgi:colanic acid/amylovoran biosynthesis glycosyltransferase